MTRKTSSKLSWPKRLSITGLILFALYLCFGVWAVPVILVSQIQGRGSEALGRELSVERATFNPFSFEVKLYGISVGPAAGESEDLLKIGKFSVNPQLSSVFGTITLKSVEISEGDIWVEKRDSGALSFQDILDAQPPAESTSGTDSELPAIIVAELLLMDLELHFKDSSVATTYEETVGIEILQGRDLGTVEKIGIDASNTEAYHWDFDGKIVTKSGATVDLDGGATSIFPWSVRLNSQLTGFPLESIQPYVDESVVAQVDGLLGFKLSERIDVTEEGVAVWIDGSLGLESVSLSDSEQVFAAFDALRVDALKLDASSMTLSVGEITLEAPAFSAILLEDGSPRLPVMKDPRGPAVENAEAQTLDFAASIDSIVLSQGKVSLEDRRIETPFRTTLDGIHLELTDLAAAQNGAEYDSSGTMDLALKALGGDVSLSANLESLKGLAEVTLALSGIQLSGLQPYVAEYANAELQNGLFDLSLTARMQGFENPVATGSLALRELKLRDVATEKEIAAIAEFKVEGATFSENTLQISRVDLIEPLLAAWQDEIGMNLERIAKLEAAVEETAEEIEAESGIKILVDRFEMKSAGVGFVDTTLLSTHNSRLSDFELTVDRLSTNPDALAAFEFYGTVDGSARIAGSGEVNVSNPEAYLDLDVSFRGYDLTSTSPYWATYLGRELSKGQFEIISRYEVRDGKMEGTNDFKIDQLTLGERVESDRAINLPLGFAIKLMQDPSGMIEYQGLRVEGDLADPQVKPWGLIGKAVRNLMLSAVTSPFKFLAKMAGGRDDLDSLAFSVGDVTLDAEAMEKVAAIKKLMTLRPGLSLEISFLPDPGEKEYLKDKYIKHLLANPDFRVVSGVDLLREFDAVALEDAVRSAYLELSVSETPASALDGSAAPVLESPVVAEASSKPERKGLVKRLAGILWLGQKGDSQSVETVPPVASASELVVASEPVADDQLPRFEEMLTRVLATREQPVFDEGWLEDVSEERILNFKAALLTGDEIEGSRVFSTEVKEAGSAEALGAILIRLSE